MKGKKIHLIKVDIRDFDSICSIMETNDIQAIFHLASYIPQVDNFEDPFQCFETNARGTLNLLHAAYLNNICRIIYSSSMSVYSQPPVYLPVDENHPTQPSTMYGASKLEGELYCSLYSKMINITILRYSGVYGPEQESYRAIPLFIKHALNNNAITLYGGGNQTNDFVYVEDVIQANLLSLEKDIPGIFNIGSGTEVSIKDVCDLIIRLTDSKSEIIISGQASSRQFRFVFDIAKSKDILGYRPLTLENGLKKYIRYLK